MYGLILLFSKRMIQMAVDTKHRETEIISQSGLAPPQWNSRLLVRSGYPKLAKWVAMRRIRKLISYFRYTPLVADEESRSVVLKTLSQVQQSWRTKEWREIYPYQ